MVVLLCSARPDLRQHYRCICTDSVALYSSRSREYYICICTDSCMLYLISSRQYYLCICTGLKTSETNRLFTAKFTLIFSYANQIQQATARCKARGAKLNPHTPSTKLGIQDEDLGSSDLPAHKIRYFDFVLWNWSELLAVKLS